MSEIGNLQVSYYTVLPKSLCFLLLTYFLPTYLLHIYLLTYYLLPT